MRRTTCTFHCRECRSHFSSLRAFDAHRDGKFGSGRFCIEPADVQGTDGLPRLTPLSDAGVCAVDKSEDVTVWTDRRALARVRELYGEAA